MIDYKINNVTLNSQGIQDKITIYSGDITTEQEENVDGVMEDVTRYRRTSVLTTKDINLDTNQVVALFSKWANKRLIEEATSRGETVISEQNSTSV